MLERRTQRLPKWNGDALFGVSLAINGYIDRSGLAGLENEGVACEVVRYPFRHRVELNRRSPPFAIEPLISQRDFGLVKFRARDTTTLAVHSPHLEKVCEIIGERDRKVDVEGTIAVVLQAQTLVDSAVQEEKRSHDVQHVLRLHKLLIEIDVWICQIDSEK